MLNGFGAFLPISSTLAMIAYPIFLYNGNYTVYFQDVEQMKMLLRLKCLAVLVGWFHELHLSLLVGYQSIAQERCSAIWLTPCRCLNQYLKIFLG